MDFEPAEQSRGRGDDELMLSLGAWEGPLDLLLALARAQKVDLRSISILELADQYLAFVGDARRLQLELAADYLVMAAWLAFLKSCLLLPRDEAADPDPEELFSLLQLRLERLAAMREAAARLFARDRIGRDVFVRGAAEGLRLVRRSAWQASAFDLYAAYGAVRSRQAPAIHLVAARAVMSLDDALERLARLIGRHPGWTRIEAFLPEPGALGASEAETAYRCSALASSFVAALELARCGRLELAQDEPFAPLWLRPA